MDRQSSDRDRKASKSVRFTDVEESSTSPRGRIASQSDLLADALLPQLAKALCAELRSVFAEEAMRWSEELQLLCRLCGSDRSAPSSKRGSRKSTLGFSSSTDAKWSEHLVKSKLQEQEKLQKRRLGRLADALRGRGSGSTWLSENSAPSEAASSPGFSPRSPCGVQRCKPVGGGGEDDDIAFTNIKDEAEARNVGASPDNVCLTFAELREGAKGSPPWRTAPLDAGGTTAGRGWQKMKSLFQQHPAKSPSCPDLAPLVSKGTPNGLEKVSALTSDEDEETCPVTSWDAASAGGVSDATSVGETIRRSRQDSRSATTPAVLKRPEVSLAARIASNPFAAYETEKSVDLQPPENELSQGEEANEPRGRTEGRDLASLAKAYGSTGSQASRASDKSIMTIASVTTTRTVATHTEELGRHYRRNADSSADKHHASTSSRGEQAPEYERGDRACMLGAAGPDKKAFARVQSTRQLAEIEQTLCAELFKAQELLPKRHRSSSSGSDGEVERITTHSSTSSRASRFAMARRFGYTGSYGASSSRNPPPVPIRPNPARNGARLPPEIVGAPSGEPALLMMMTECSPAGDDTFSPVNPSPPSSPKAKTFFRWPSFARKSGEPGADASEVRRTARKNTPETSRSQLSLSSLHLSERQNSAELSTAGSAMSAATCDTTPSRSTTPARAHRKKMSCSEMRQQQEKALVESFTQELQNVEVCEQSPGAASTDSRLPRATVEGACRRLTVVLPRACGVDPWNSHHPRACAFYQWIIILLALSCTVLFTLNAYEALSQEEHMGTGQAAGLSFVLNVILSLGALLSLVACGSLWRSQAIHDIGKMLRAYALKYGFVDEWEKGSLRDLGLSLTFWLGAVAIIVTTEQRSAVDVAFAFIGLLHVGIITCVLHTCRCLANMIDAFCDALVDRPDVSKAAFNWNLFQAVCRTACGSIQAVFTVQQAMATSAAVVCVADLRHGFGLGRALVLAPTLLLILAIVRTSVCAAAISDKCARVPMLVNSLEFGSESDLDRDRMYIVEYIVHSRAGFYIFDVRLTSASVLKAVYIAGAVALGLVSQML